MDPMSRNPITDPAGGRAPERPRAPRWGTWGAGTVSGVGGVRDTVVSDLVPGNALRAAINLGNPVLAQGPAAAPAGVTVDIARELGVRLGVAVVLVGGPEHQAAVAGFSVGQAGRVADRTRG